MATLLLTCPLESCGLPMTAVTIVAQRAVSDEDKAGQVNGHLHLLASGNVSCANGHRWLATDSFLLSRQQG